jgi:hypothetical protein
LIKIYSLNVIFITNLSNYPLVRISHMTPGLYSTHNDEMKMRIVIMPIKMKSSLSLGFDFTTTRNYRIVLTRRDEIIAKFNLCASTILSSTSSMELEEVNLFKIGCSRFFLKRVNRGRKSHVKRIK